MNETTKNQPGRRGPLKDLRVVEFAGIGPGPFACMLLSDMGADVVTVDRPGARMADARQVVQRGRTVVHADLKDAADIERVLTLLENADVLVEGFRPGVMERLGLGPDVVARRNPRLVYARMTGWGQTGPLALAAGHDINYIAITGALHAIGTAERPVPPLNLLGDYGGGSLYLVVGVLAAVHEARLSGRGQVVDAAISDGVVSLMAQFISQGQRGTFKESRESNLLDGGTPWYGVYETADAGHVSIGALEPQFFARFCEVAGVAPEWHAVQKEEGRWPAFRDYLSGHFRQRTLADWQSILEGSDSCFAPVLPLSEAMRHPHIKAREAFVSVEGVVHPAPAPRFSRTPSAVQSPPASTKANLGSVVTSWLPTD
ncbi:Succinyl-CoA:(R)-benzylsuccinate CoA-transferase subunit BbsE [Variovorax sp. SRS16]|uniref:CaiB/BaiF CoA transferase family protein n=1 Tax=Variovorax sp. SRS16 TaxID=282217 RepID=UPI001318F117|nr:CaiB/BaiF CoA-transferase family protein [Variovorax sp. SRS16]VTU20616.1 Succinyl-CoA:(R)-benzylsuccinate CoA-transferase subunit BbsE [Variovorax sp. SRS16]